MISNTFIKGHEDRYIIYEDGRVYDIKKYVFITINLSNKYPRVVLNSKCKNLHILLYQAFKGDILPGHEIHHIYEDKNNYSLSNLEQLTYRKHHAISRINKGNKTSVYTGVSFDSSNNKYIATIRIKGRKINLGRFVKEEDAAMAYQLALAINE